MNESLPDWFDSAIHSVGKTCKYGHFIRYINGNKDCVECVRRRALSHQQLKSDEYKAYQKKYRKANQTALSISAMEREKKYKENPDRAKRIDIVRRAAVDNWQSNNHGTLKAIVAKRRAAKLKRTPKWADLKTIKEIYLNCPEGMTVDHFYPLQGKLVSGLHVENNLQYLTLAENCSKHNKCTSEMLEWVVFE